MKRPCPKCGQPCKEDAKQCRPCYNKEVAVTVRRCACGARIEQASRTGKCIACYTKAIAKPVRHCGCGARIGKDNTTGKCIACYRGPSTTPKACECGARLTTANKSGKCFNCLHPRRSTVIGTGATVRRVIAEAEHVFDVSRDDLIGRGRLKHACLARFAVMAELNRRGMGRSEIGRRLGRHPSVVDHGIERARQLARDENYARQIAALARSAA